jgi:nitrogen fixation/metabolism regulation signal transduction histidine kinase
MIRQITESTVQLAQSQKEVAWREMAKQVAHEIKNPLTPMKLSLQLLQRASKSSSPEEFKAMAQRLSISLLEQIDGLADIATAFSNFARMPEAQNENLNLNELVASTFELFRNDAAELDMHLEICFEICQIYADKTQIIRVLNNLIKNAIQAIPENQKGKITVALTTQNQNAIIQVTDNGHGIPPEKKANIFVPNFTTKSSGMGLGLAMSKNIIEAASGTLSFQSNPNVQTTFTISLPLIYD